MSEQADWSERVVMLSVHPDAALREDVAQLAADLMDARRLLVVAVPMIEAYWGSSSPVERRETDQWLEKARELTR